MVPASGPWVSPMRNLRPAQIEQQGQTVAAAGGAVSRIGNEIGDAVRQTVDVAQTKAAETQFLKTSQDILNNPKTGYLYTRGLNAQAAWNPTTEALAKARQDQRATLTNPAQQRMFDEMTNDHMLTIARQIDDHQHNQVTEYGIQQSQDRAESLNIQARSAYLQGRMVDYHRNSALAENEALNVADLNGAARDSDVAQAIVRKVRTDLVQGITLSLRDDHKIDEMKQFFDDNRDHIDMRTAETLGNFVKTEYDRNLVEVKGDGYLKAAATPGGAVPHTYGPLATGSTINPMKITDVPGSPRPGGRTHDGYDIAMATGTSVTAPLDGKVVKVWDDEKFGGGLSMRVQLADGNTLGLAHLSAANLKEGDQVNRGQVIGLSGRTGNATGPTLHVALMDKDGKYVDYFGASKAQPDQADIANPNVLEKAIDAAQGDSSLDPFQKKQVVKYMESQHSHQRAIQEQQYQDVKQQAVDYYYQNRNINGLPAAIKSQLKPEDVFRMSRPPATETDPETMTGFILDPKTVTVPNVKNAFADGKLSDSAYFSLLSDAAGFQDKNKLFDATVEADRIQYFADQAGIPNIYKQKTEADKRTYAQMLTRVQTEIDQAQQQKQGKLSQTEKDAIVQRNLQQHVITHLRSAWNPLAWFGSKTYSTGVRQFEIPAGATGYAASKKDGKLHFTDSKGTDLGVVPENEAAPTNDEAPE